MDTIFLIIGILIGIAVSAFVLARNAGCLHVDTTDPDGPFIFLESQKNMDEILKKHHVRLKVVITREKQ